MQKRGMNRASTGRGDTDENEQRSRYLQSSEARAPEKRRASRTVRKDERMQRKIPDELPSIEQCKAGLVSLPFRKRR